MLTKAVEQKSNKVAELKERLNQLQIRNTSLKAELSTKESACSDFDSLRNEHELQKVQYERISRSSIAKADYYEPEPDYYKSDVIDF